MNNAMQQPGDKVRPRTAPHLRRTALRIARRTWRSLRVPWLRWLTGRKVVWIRFPTTWSSARKYLAIIPATLFVALVLFSLITIIRGEKGWIEKRCSDTGNACGVVLGFASPFLSLALAAAVFVVYRYWKMLRPIVRKAKHEPDQLLPTAGTPLEQTVVGREQLCQVICRSLCDRTNRRPYLLVGSVGAGKTAVLIRLTQMLAQHRLVPVPISLRDVGTDGAQLDFRDLARRRFTEEIDPAALLSSEQRAKVWRQLCKDGRVVVLADGLEEALNSRSQMRDRDEVIRAAILRAEEQDLPLVIASRPHTPLDETYASIIDLEPLSEDAALDYLAWNAWWSDIGRLGWIVETAVLSESPLYMEISRELCQHDLLEFVYEGWGGQLNTASRDRSTLRRHLLKAWVDALIDGRLRQQVPLAKAEREKTIRTISALAALGLLGDRLAVRYDDLLNPERRLTGRPELMAAAQKLREELAPLLPAVDIRRRESLIVLYASRGEQLGLVKTLGDRVRFPQSIVQAYLGSQVLGLIEDEIDAALRSEAFGRDLLVGLVLRSCEDTPETTAELAERLWLAARSLTDAKALDLFAAALEVDLHAQRAVPPNEPVSIHQRIADSLCEVWPNITSGNLRTLVEAKVRLVHRFGEVVREIARLGREKRWPADADPPAYQRFLRIAFQEQDYALRLAITREIGAGGDAAFDALRALFRSDHQVGEVDPVEEYFVQLAGQRDGAPATQAGYPQDAQEATRIRRQLVWRQFATLACVLPMLVGSVGVERKPEAAAGLSIWLKHLDPSSCLGGRADLPLSFEVALAQGFKSTANRRMLHPDTTNDTRVLLIEQAETMLARSRFWLSQLTLIHALCLWALTDGTGMAVDRQDDGTGGRHGPTADPEYAVSRWLAMAGAERSPVDRGRENQVGIRERLHPFVARAAQLAVLALETGRPERYIWIDEKTAMENVGSAPGDPRSYRRHNLWIPPSVGWTTLDPRAQQLLADVLLLLNLTERSGDPDAMERRLERSNRSSLPPCLTRDRSPLQPERTVGMANIAEPGTTCRNDCPFALCPYPPKGEQPQAELREVFCLQQQALLSWRRGWFTLSRRRAPWQSMTCPELRHFWHEMAARARTPRL
ncbi:ATP-binding protein [Streptomyces albospinus]|nr:ATP-binding protein [Streptomyces albospinus]